MAETTVSGAGGDEALAWARRAVEEHGLDPQTCELAVELYRPGAAEPIDAFERAVRADAEGPSILLYRVEGSLGDYAVGALLKRLDEPDLRTVLLWALASHHCRIWPAEPKQQALRRKEGNLRADILGRPWSRDIQWSAAELSFMLRVVAEGGTEPLPLAACERADDAELAACRAELRAVTDLLETERTKGRFPASPEIEQEVARHLEADRARRRLPACPEIQQGRARWRAVLSRAVGEARTLFDPDDAFYRLLERNAPRLLDAPGLAELLRFCMSLQRPRPAAEWRRGLAPLLGSVPGAAGVVRALLEQVPLLGDDEVYRHYREVGMVVFGSEGTVLMLRGLLWCVDALPREDTAWAGRVLGELACRTGTGRGGSKVLRAERLATAAIAALAERGDDAAVAALSRVQARTKKKTVLNAAERALSSVAARLDLTSQELMERTVPDFGLDAHGRREEEMAGCAAVLTAGGDGTASLTFRSAAGKPVKSAPKAVREDRPERLKELRGEVKEMKAALAAERHRLETALGEGRTWDVAAWRRYYLEHPLTGLFARRLLWEVSTDAGAGWRTGLPEHDGEEWRLVGPDGAEVFHTGAASAAPPVLRMWHPIRWRPAEIGAWRDRLMETELLQPFKQAFREVYLLTPAEEATRVYSNRYAAHILKYGQAKALLTEREWSGLQLGFWEGGQEGRAERVYRDAASGQEWLASFFLHMVEHDAYGFSEVAYCSTDQVRFCREGLAEAAELREVPALVFSEAMRDVDLAVGVTSIAADPEWSDTGANRYRVYWQETGFGELTESGEMRRAALERIVPRLKIADRLELTGRFLKVRGGIRTYKIHLGSANILMEPDDSYLCIVSTPAEDGRIHLPFESGGGRLSVILSKAFLLAADTEITDASITGQLRRGTD